MEKEYKKADNIFSKRNLSEFFSSNLIPTKRTNYFLLGIIIFVLLMSLVKFPLNSFLSGNLDNLEVKVGYPLSFMVIDISSPQDQPFKFWPLILDLFLYLLIAYLVDISIGVISKYSSSKIENLKFSSSGLIKKDVNVVEVE